MTALGAERRLWISRQLAEPEIVIHSGDPLPGRPGAVPIGPFSLVHVADAGDVRIQRQVGSPSEQVYTLIEASGRAVDVTPAGPSLDAAFDADLRHFVRAARSEESDDLRMDFATVPEPGAGAGAAGLATALALGRRARRLASARRRPAARRPSAGHRA